MCQEGSEAWKYGFYRRLDSGKWEFISYCNPEVVNWVGMHERDLNRFLDAYLPRKNK